jgi:hypothetical protein
MRELIKRFECMGRSDYGFGLGGRSRSTSCQAIKSVSQYDATGFPFVSPGLLTAKLPCLDMSSDDRGAGIHCRTRSHPLRLARPGYCLRLCTHPRTRSPMDTTATMARPIRTRQRSRTSGNSACSSTSPAGVCSLQAGMALSFRGLLIPLGGWCSHARRQIENYVARSGASSCLTTVTFNRARRDTLADGGALWRDGFKGVRRFRSLRVHELRGDGRRRFTFMSPRRISATAWSTCTVSASSLFSEALSPLRRSATPNFPNCSMPAHVPEEGARGTSRRSIPMARARSKLQPPKPPRMYSGAFRFI